MNKTFKIIWSKARNCYVVASELAKRRTKSPKSRIFSKAFVVGILSCILNIGFAGHVFAETYYMSGNHVSDGQVNPGTNGYSIYGLVHSITVNNGKLTGISFLTINDNSEGEYGHSQSYSLGSSDGGTTYTAGNGLALSGTTFSAIAGTNVTVDGNGVSVTGNGSVADGNTGLINGDKLYDEVRPSDNGNYEEYFSTLL